MRPRQKEAMSTAWLSFSSGPYQTFTQATSCESEFQDIKGYSDEW